MFLGGRQRGNGEHQFTYLQMDGRNHFTVLNNMAVNKELVVNTPLRRTAWGLLPPPGNPFTYTQGESLCVPAAMKSSSTYSDWLAQCRQKGIITDSSDGKLTKACN